MEMRRCEDLLTRQGREVETLKESVKEYQLKIVHIENANAKHLQERVRQEVREHENRLYEKETVIVEMQKERK
jgi:hypothetical protein